jgi:hypothetical protein
MYDVYALGTPVIVAWLGVFLQIGDATIRKTWEKDGENRLARISACFDRVLPKQWARLSEPP